MEGHHDVDEALIAHFHERSGFSRPADAVDADGLERTFRSDLASSSA